MKKGSFFDKAGTRSVLASLVAILVGMLAGGVIILIVGLTNPSLGIKGAWEGIRLVVTGPWPLRTSYCSMSFSA